MHTLGGRIPNTPPWGPHIPLQLVAITFTVSEAHEQNLNGLSPTPKEASPPRASSGGRDLGVLAAAPAPAPGGWLERENVLRHGGIPGKGAAAAWYS